jgi:hypothetical protein
LMRLCLLQVSCVPLSGIAPALCLQTRGSQNGNAVPDCWSTQCSYHLIWTWSLLCGLAGPVFLLGTYMRAFLAWDVGMVCAFMDVSSCAGWFPDPWWFFDPCVEPAPLCHKPYHLSYFQGQCLIRRDVDHCTVPSAAFHNSALLIDLDSTLHPL